MRIGVLALQGCIEPHFKHLNKIGVDGVYVKTLSDLEAVDGLIMPGGESTTMLKFLHRTGLFQAIKEFGRSKPIWGICAGSILIASKVINPAQESLGLIDILAERNHYGTQQDSFTETIQLLNNNIEVCFIRAPLLTEINSKTEVLARNKKNAAVLIKQGQILASSFHIELGDNSILHKYFCDLVSSSCNFNVSKAA